MSSNDRRELIYASLLNSQRPLKGTDLARKHGVTRQIIVKDIAILRAKGNNIIATPDGYMINDDSSRVKSIIAVKHSDNAMFDEMEIVVKYGGIIEDVIVEHPIYGEIRGVLRIKNLNDLNKFKKSIEEIEVRPLSLLTDGIHLHTISADSNENMQLIKDELKEKGFIL